MKTLQDTRSLLQKRSVYLAFTILFLLFPLSFKFNANGLEWMWADTPVNAVIFAALGRGSRAVFGASLVRAARCGRGVSGSTRGSTSRSGRRGGRFVVFPLIGGRHGANPGHPAKHHAARDRDSLTVGQGTGRTRSERRSLPRPRGRP